MTRCQRLAEYAVPVGLMFAGLGGCASSQVVLVGEARAALPPDQVQIFLQPPESAYREIAYISASSRGSGTISRARKINKVIERLKNRAALLGANGILLHGVENQAAGSIGAGISTETNYPHSPYGLGFGGSAFFSQESGEGVAIYVEPK